MNLRGAEATVTVKENEVLKERTEKKYRHNKLDQRIRKQRTNTEYNTLKKAFRNNVSVPKVKKESEYILNLEKIEGKTLEEDFNPEIMLNVGENVQKLHSTGLIHGDLTTKNIISSDQIVLIDFGLSQESSKTEDRAIDLHLLKQVLDSSHPEHAEEAWEKFLQGYQPNFREDVLKRLDKVEKRGRYK